MINRKVQIKIRNIRFAFPDECGTREPINVAEHLKEMSIFVALASFFSVCKSFFALSYFTFFYIFRHAFINPFQWQTIESMRILSTNCKYLIRRNWKAPLVWICRGHISFCSFTICQPCDVMWCKIAITLQSRGVKKFQTRIFASKTFTFFSLKGR